MADKSKEEFIKEISLLQKRIAEIEILDAECRQAEERVKKQYESLKTIMDSLSYPFYVIDTNYTIILVNQAAKEKGIVEGSRCHQVTHHSQEPCSAVHVCPLKEVIRTGEPVITEHIHFDNKGNSRNFEVHGDPIIDKDGQVINMIEYSIDITERKRAEEENKKCMQELQTTYSSLKETQDQLIQSSKMASLGQMAGSVAHEINNPLTGVLNNVQLIKMVAGNKESFDLKEFKELLDVIEESAMRCKQITQSLLDFSHSPTGVFQPLSLNEIVKKVDLLIAHELKLQSIPIHKDLQPDLPLISGDS
ncbi:MAG: PAS domain-containing protein, partial [Candidatus Omnitrophica bacterium]|nr:PAS domain-containing protein [Candidatus Omnitrophota bacterium]